MDNQTKAGVEQLEQTTEAENLAGEMRPETEGGVQAKQNDKLDNSRIDVNNE